MYFVSMRIDRKVLAVCAGTHIFLTKPVYFINLLQIAARANYINQKSSTVWNL